jgi:PilZ domain
MFVERRSFPRITALKHGEIVFNDNRTRLSCIVVNSSDKGAMLRVRNDAAVPNTFDLHLDNKVHAAWVVWKNNGALGVNWFD